MKRLFFATALAVGGLGVMMPTQNAMAQDVATVASAGKGIKWLAKRIYSLDLGTRVYEMEQDGVPTRSFVAVMTAEGALVQNYELAGGDSEGVNKVGRQAGFQILPYTVSITSDGRRLLSVGGIAFKNMNEAYKNVQSIDGYGIVNDSIWTVINNLQVLTFEWDENYSFNNTSRMRIDVVRADARLDILGASKPGHFLAVVGGGSFGFEKQLINDGEQSIAISQSDSVRYKKMFEKFEYQVGLEYNLPVLQTHRINAKVLLNGGYVKGHNFNQADQDYADAQNAEFQEVYDQGMASYNSQKEQYELANYEGQEISHQTYQDLTGNLPPDLEEVNYNVPEGRRTYMYLSPSLSYGGKFKNSKGLRYDISVFGNIPISDDYQGGGMNVDFAGSAARPLVGAGIKLKF